ncbi:MAG: MotA/TolQ/ExbB proton channel family protein [Kiritimatiellia bacterium]
MQTVFMPGALPLIASADILQIILLSDLMGKSIMLLLIGGSIWVWYMMITKNTALRRAQHDAERFLATYRKALHPLLVIDRKGNGHNPIEAVYKQSYAAMEAVLDVQGISVDALLDAGSVAKIRLSDRQIDSVRNAAERAVSEQALLLEADMNTLASASSLAPFCGLFGTVWGVMRAFGAMTGSGSALLSEVAPGISSALATTVLGLLVAIPSVYGYNKLSDQIRCLTVVMDNFAQEVTGDLERMHRA